MAKRHRNDDEDGNERRSIRLPGSLLDQIKTKEDKGEYEDDNSRYTKFDHSNKKRKGPQLTRKEQRKQDRLSKKEKKSGNKSKDRTGGSSGGGSAKVVNSNGNGNGNGNINGKGNDPLAVLKALKEAKKAKANDPLSQLKALKEKKNGSTQRSQVKVIKEDDLDDDEISDFDDFEVENEEEEDDGDDEQDPLELLRALKEKKGGKSGPITSDIKIVKEDDLNDDEISDDFEEEDDSEILEDEEDDYDEEDYLSNPLSELAALKSKKQGKSSELRVVKAEDLEDDDMSDFDIEDDEEEGDEPEEEDDADEDEDAGYEQDPIAKLKALKEAASKKSKKSRKKDEPIDDFASFDDEMIDRDDNDMNYYAKKLGLKKGKSSKLSKLDDNDEIGGLLDGLDLDFAYSDSEKEESSEEYGDSNDDDDEEESEAERENPYVAPVDKSRTDETIATEEEAPTRYLPPALRRKLAAESSGVSEEVLNVRKAIKGPLNKLSEANIGTIVNEINNIYLSNPRHTVNEELTTTILDNIIQQGRLLENFVYLHAVVVVAIYRIQGVEFGAYFVQILVEKFEQFLKDVAKDKQASNIVSLLSSIYLFQLVSSKLLYDIIKVLINDLNEQNAELLLRLIRTSGNQMRSDDPTALKEIILMINSKVKELSKGVMSTRMEFLIETINSLKQNKLKITNEANTQLSIRLKKFLGGINNNKFSDPIRVSLDDVHNIETKGKWWLVGSAWKGDDDSAREKNVDEAVLNDILDNAEPNWMDLARSQRMNTDIRRAIFISIMSANDYVDALTKLDKLALKRSQEREIPRVLLHCTGVEPAWNPYYGILAKKLCDSHNYRKTFQFMLWDLIKEFEGSNDGDNDEDFLGFDYNGDDSDAKLKRILNLGRFFGYLIAEEAIPIHLLRTINFLTASSDTVLFMEVCFVTFLDLVGKKSQINAVGGGLSKKSANNSEQKFDDRKLIEIAINARDQITLLRGIQYFLQEKVKKSTIISGKKQQRRVAWGINALSDIIEEFASSKEE